MLFLSHLRELSWVYSHSGKVGVARRLTERKTGTSIPWRTSHRMLSIKETKLHDRAQDQHWIRYDAEVPVPKKLARAFKATGETTTVSVAVPSKAGTNVLYAGLPTKLSLDLPYIIGAAFDPNTARTQIQQDNWNEWLWKQTSGLVTTLVLHLLKEAPTKAWQLIPASDETSVAGDSWVEERIEDLATVVWEAVRKKGEIITEDIAPKLSKVSYEDKALDGLLTNEDLSTLAPKNTPLPAVARDSDGRWRRILDDLQIGKRLDLEGALDLLPLCAEQPLARCPEWYVRLVCKALDDGLRWKLSALPCVLVDDPVELLTPDSNGSLFSTDDTITPLASRLGLVRRLHDSLLGEDQLQERIREWLEGLERLSYRLDATTVLEAITRRGTSDRLELGEDDLVELRDLIDDIDEPDPELLVGVGRSVAISVYQYINNKRVFGKMSIDKVYLPPAMSEAEGWPKVAGSTPGLKWAAPMYATLLDPGDRQSGKSGARRFLGMLGASNVFRLVGCPKRSLRSGSVPALHDQEFQEFETWPEYLSDDYISPDLESVIEDICSAPRKERYDRGLILLRMLNRHWRKSLQQKSFCTAFYKYYRERELGVVSATWIARLSDRPWLYNDEKKPARPLELTIRSPLTEGLFGDARSRFAAGIQDDLTPGLASALGFEERPKASDIVSVLAELRATGEYTGWTSVRSYYAYLATMCPDSSSPANPKAKIDDMTVGELRGRFGIHPQAQGLIAIDGTWKAPTAIRQGRRIFGDRRSFIPTSGYEKLWHALGIREPNIADCVAVLQEIASDGDADSEASVLTDTFRHLNALLERATAKDRHALAAAPLWSGAEWATRRPIYYIADETASQSLAATHTMWEPPCSLEGMDLLVEGLGVTPIPPENCTPTGVEPDELRIDQSSRERFSSTVEALRDFLAKNQPGAYMDIDIEWPELSNARIAVSPSLGLEVSLPGGEQVDATTNAHMIQEPLTVCVQNERLLYDYDAGGRVISQCFGSSEHRQIVRLAWSNPNALDQRPGSTVTLADDVPAEEDPLDALKHRVDKNVGKAIAGKRKIQPTSTQDVKRPYLEPRRLKPIDSISVKKAEIVNADAPQGRQLPDKKTPPAPQNPDGPPVGTRSTGGAAPMGYTPDDREQLALQVLEGVVWDNKVKLKDFTRLKGLGADAGDALDHLFELKAHGGDMPDSVSIELSQRRAANESPEKFYLAVVSGLEEGYETVVKLFARPMETLDMEKGTSIRLSGIHSKRAIEVRLSS